MKTLTELNQVTKVLAENNMQFLSFAHNFSYDTYLSQFYFEEFKEDWKDQSLWFYGRNGTDYIVFFTNKEIMRKPYYKVSNLRKMSKQSLHDLCVYYALIYDNGNLNIFKKTELIDSLMCISNEEFYTKHFEETSYYDLDCDFAVSGYSQGDAFKVKLIGTPKQFKDSDRCNLVNNESLTNLFFDAPMHLRLQILINGEESEEIDFIEWIDMYSYYDKAKVINVVKAHYSDHEHYEALLEYCENELPNNLDYTN